MKMKLETLSALEYGKLINQKQLSPIEGIEYFIDRIERINPKINAFTYTKFDEALDEAKELSKQLHKNKYCGLFAGVPVALKDFLPSKKGWTNSHGGVKILTKEDDCDSEFYKAAKKLGCIALGKTNAPAFGFSGTCRNEQYGATRNPFDINRTSGGSSGGTAAAVAAGLVLLGEGGDAGGSIRIPSAWCNLFGMKPSLGTVPSVIRPDAWSATHPYCFNGCLTKTVEDSAIMLRTMSYYDPRDPHSLPINSHKDFYQLLSYSDLVELSIGYTYDFDLFPSYKDVSDAMTASILLLKSLGASVEPIHFDWNVSLQEMIDCWAWGLSLDSVIDIARWQSEGIDLLNDYTDYLPPEFIHYINVAKQQDVHDMFRFNCVRTNILDNFENIFDQYDAIVAPTALCSPMLLDKKGHVIEEHSSDSSSSFIDFATTFIVNFVGYPAASVPCGMDANDMPFGLHIIGKQFQDEDVLNIAHCIQKKKRWSYLYPEL